MAMLQEEARLSCEDQGLPADSRSLLARTSVDRNFIFFKSDRMYKHHLLRINYTTYDVRLAQDVINPRTSHCDIMVLASDDEPDAGGHRFWFARVLGIYHVNVIYTGPGVLDYSPRRLDFVWVRWFQCSEPTTLSWQECRLDSVSFLPMANNNAFGFLDPNDIVRGCHVMPSFTSGRMHTDGIALSRCARDSRDWKSYVINRYGSRFFATFHLSIISTRFVDRDMVMRYHWGLAVGHDYAHTQKLSKAHEVEVSEEMDDSDAGDPLTAGRTPELDEGPCDAGLEYSLESRDDDHLELSGDEDGRERNIQYDDEFYTSED